MASRRGRKMEGLADESEVDLDAGGYVQAVLLIRERVESFHAYPYSIPAVGNLDTLELHPKVTFFVGENGSGKSTLIEAIAVAAGFNAEGGSKNFNFKTRNTESQLHNALRLKRGIRREQDGFFLRAESLYNVATNIEVMEEEEAGLLRSYGGTSLHRQSHGESFLALATNRFRGQGLYLLDEPESALSPARQLALLRLIHIHVQDRRSQFIIATHSPILLGYPDATIYQFSNAGIAPIEYEETEHYQITRGFLNSRESVLRQLFANDQ
jgi:predicted ATPase